MDWTTIAVLESFIVACLLAIYQSRGGDWAINRKVGAATFLLGAAVGLFPDDLVVANSPILPRIELIGASVMVIGLLITWVWQPG